MPRNTVQAVGNSTYTFTHPLINNAQAVNLSGIRLDSEYLTARQIIDNSKVVPMIDGSVITLTNNVRAGMFTIQATDNGLSISEGNIVAIARALQQSGDSLGGQLRVATTVNGQVNAITLTGVTLKVFDLIKLAGNDVPTYPVEFNFQDWQAS